jgi:gliding motility-associated-like protein
MTNNAPGGCGNDLVLDDITFRPCGAKVAGTIEGADVTKDLCFGDRSSVTLSGAVQPDINTVYQWQSSADNGSTWTDVIGATSKNYTRGAFNAAGIYLYRLTVSQSTGISITSCRVSSNILTINVNALPLTAATNNGPVCEGKPLIVSANGGTIYDWTGPLNFKSTVQSPTITNATTSLAGKYFVTVTSSKGCVQKDSTDVSVIKGPQVTVDPTSISMCEGDRKTLNAVGTNVVSYSWEPSRGLSASNIASPVASPIDTTTYTVTAANANCTTTASVVVNVLKKPFANAGPDKEILEGSSVQLDGFVKGTDVSYTWSPTVYLSAANTVTPEASPPRDTTYTLRVTSNKGCGTASDQITVRVFKKLVVPNAFSPNGDGINDLWIIKHISEYNNAEVSVFNRYGSTVFFRKGVYRPWDGTYNKGNILPPGTYYYLIDLKNGQQKYVGWLLIIK